jgi:hypothetical protein
MSILGEEYGEACQDAVGLHWHHYGSLSDQQVLAKLRTELIHTAAVAMQIIEHIDEEATP